MDDLVKRLRDYAASDDLTWRSMCEREAANAIEELQRRLGEARSILDGINWRSDDKDNMEFAARITYVQMDAIRAHLQGEG